MSSQTQIKALVTTEWIAEHAKDSGLRVVEVDVDPTNYEKGHIDGAVGWNWKKDLQDQLARDIAPKEALEQLLGKSGITPDTTIVVYGDNNNWFAAWFLWNLKYYGHKDARLMNGGRKKWIDEDRPLPKEPVTPPVGSFTAGEPNEKLRVYYDEVRASLPKVKAGSLKLVDVRGPKEFSGEVTAPPEYPTEHAQRGGHIPGAANIPWAQAVNDNGTFKSREELEKLYTGKGVTPNFPVITYCRIGERSSHTWFVLRHLLGYPNVRN
ncbi:MAG TPA: sulfurtransferase, partial [Candidatus Dormibacteraeota bacterium]|nr:sulfurtransferase [Candidatus Dormibacteraeota bacterium]